MGDGRAREVGAGDAGRDLREQRGAVSLAAGGIETLALAQRTAADAPRV